jgi:hypothetical protein
MNYIEEYLLKLGGTVDQPSIARLNATLRDVERLVEAHSLGMTKAFVGAQASIVGGFASIGAAALGLVDKVAMADQQYRLFGLHLFLAKDAARSLKIAMDALGQPLENLTWDPELRGRATQLFEDQRKMARELGPDFEMQMRRIRDIRFEFTRMQVELQYVSMRIVEDFMQRLGLGPDDLLKRLRKINDWVINDLPQISQEFLRYFMPVWEDAKKVVAGTFEAMKEGAVVFTNLVGLFSGDTSIEGTTFSLDKLAVATHHVSAGFAQWALDIAAIETLLAHLINSLTLVSTGHFKEAYGELKAAGDSITTKQGMELLGGTFGMVFGGPMGAFFGAAASSEFADALINTIGAKPVEPGSDKATQGLMNILRNPLPPPPTFGVSGGAFPTIDLHTGISGDISKTATVGQLIDMLAPKFGVDPALAHAIAMHESGEKQYSKGNVLLGKMTSTGRAIGAFQLMQSVGDTFGIDPYSTQGNVIGGLMLISHLMQTYHGDLPKVLAGFAAGEGTLDKVLAGKATLSAESRASVASELRALGRTGSVQIGSITINVPGSNLTPDQLRSSVGGAITDSMRAIIMRNQQEFQDFSAAYPGS